MDAKDRQRIREAFLAAANSPAADKYIDHGDHQHHIAEILRGAADSDHQYEEIDRAIADGRTTVDKFIAMLQKNYPN